MGGVGGFVPTPQGVGNGYGQPPQDLIGGVDDFPIVGGGFGFSECCLHRNEGKRIKM